MQRMLDGFQLVALGGFLVMFLGRTIYLWRVRGVTVLTLGRGKPPLQAAGELGFAVGLPVWVYEVVAHAVPLRRHVFPAAWDVIVIDAVAVQLLGCVLIVGGLVIFALALAAFGDSWRVGIDKHAPGVLVRSGIFAASRNPIFLFMDLYAIGTFLVTGRLFFLLSAVVAVCALHYQIRQEEAFLAEQYGDAYREYCARASRYIGWRGM